jgi:hypothetical protein
MSLHLNDNKNRSKNEYLSLALTIFAETTGWIAFPVIGALFLGQWLDEKQGTGQLYFFSITALAFVISSVGIGLTGVKYMKRIEAADARAKADKEKEEVNKESK